jgi:hypothetical protein
MRGGGGVGCNNSPLFQGMPYFCEDSIQVFNTVVFLIYTFVLLFRILIVVAAFFPPNEE